MNKLVDIVPVRYHLINLKSWHLSYEGRVVVCKGVTTTLVISVFVWFDCQIMFNKFSWKSAGSNSWFQS